MAKVDSTTAVCHTKNNKGYVEVASVQFRERRYYNRNGKKPVSGMTTWEVMQEVVLNNWVT